MYKLYNEVLRKVGREGKDTAYPEGVPYVTTIHLIASGLVKLGRVQNAQTLYRGVSRALPDM